MSNDGGYSPPRRMRMKNNGTTHGALAAPWADLEFNSEVYEVASDRQSLIWNFPHPDDSDDLVRMVLTWFEQNTTEGGPFWRNLYWRMDIEYIYHGTTYASGHTQDTGDGIYFRGTYAGTYWGRGSATSALPWTGSIGDPLFVNMGNTLMRCSLWEEQDDWHPYRYGP